MYQFKNACHSVKYKIYKYKNCFHVLKNYEKCFLSLCVKWVIRIFIGARWWLARIKLITTNICAGAFNRVSLCRARLLGRRWWIPVDLSRSHFHHENTISLGSGSDRSKRFCQFPLSRNPFHREPLFAESASSHGSNISGDRKSVV